MRQLTEKELRIIAYKNMISKHMDLLRKMTNEVETHQCITPTELMEYGTLSASIERYTCMIEQLEGNES